MTTYFTHQHIDMVLTRPLHRRSVPGAISFANGACQLACCDPRARQEVTHLRTPLSYECRLAFLMACSRSVPRLGEDCEPALRRLPLEVIRRIIDLSVTVDRRVITRAPPPHRSALSGDDGGLIDATRGMSLNMPV